MPDGNGAASALAQLSSSARQGLGSLASVIGQYQQYQLQKPQAAANVAATQAGTKQTQQQTDQANQLFNDVQLPKAKLDLQSAGRENQLGAKNLYLNTVQKPDVSADLTSLPGTFQSTDAQGNPVPWVKVPYDEAVAGGHAAQADNPPDSWSVPYDSSQASKPFLQQPSAIQEAMISRVIKGTPDGSAPVTRAEAKAALAQQDYKELQATLPPVTPYSVPGGLQIQSLEGGPNGTTFKAVNPGSTPILDSNGARSGQAITAGEIKPDINALTPADVTQRQQALTDLQATRDETDKIQAMLSKNPDIVGPSMTQGSTVAQDARKVGAFLGTKNPNFSQQKQIEQYLGALKGGVLAKGANVRNSTEFDALLSRIPSQDSPKDVWDDFLGRMQTTLSKEYNDQSGELKKAGIPASNYTNRFQPALPSVSRAASIAPPKSGASGDTTTPGTAGDTTGAVKTVTTAAEYKALPSGKNTSFKDANGKVWVKP